MSAAERKEIAAAALATEGGRDRPAGPGADLYGIALVADFIQRPEPGETVGALDPATELVIGAAFLDLANGTLSDDDLLEVIRRAWSDGVRAAQAAQP